MHRLAMVALFVLSSYAAATVAVEAHDVALTMVAANLGYQYAYLGPEDAVALTRPGVVILIRPGERLFDVNDRTETVDGPPPHFYQSDLYVSATFIGRLRQIASHYPLASLAERSEVAGRSNTDLDLPTQVNGAISALDVRQVPGQQELSVSGKGPANVPITLSLVGTFSSEIPDVVLTRTKVFTSNDGRFSADVSVAPGYFRGAYLTVVASSLPGVKPQSYRMVTQAPNADVSVPGEQEQRSIR